jgi:hypothetical protein
MGSLEDAFDVIADGDMWEEAAAVLGGFLAPTVARNVLEGETEFDVPDEAYGVGVLIVANWSPLYAREMQVGGGVYAVDKFLARIGLKQRITQVGA